MKKTLLLFLCLPILAIGQIRFEKGYFISNDGTRTDCLIRNADWKNNPESFQYRLNPESEIQTGSIRNIAAFAIESGASYLRAEADLDRSSNNPARLDFDSQPNFEKQTVFLEVLVEGPATLYGYEAPWGVRFFYATGAGEPAPLVYKKYRREGMKILENAAFRQTLWNLLKCEDLKQSAFDNLAYKKDALIRIFTRYNTCKDPTFKTTAHAAKGLDFNFTVRPGYTQSAAKLNLQDTEFPMASGFRMGLEFEVMLPFNKNKWALLIEPVYRSYKESGEGSSSGYEMTYSSIEFAIGARHYFFVQPETAIFLTAYLLNDMELDAEITTPGLVYSTLEINPFSNAAVGIGFEFKKRWSAEFRYDFERELLRYNYADARFDNISIILGYTLF